MARGRVELTLRQLCGMRSRVEMFAAFRLRSALAHCLGVAFTLTACGGPAPVNSIDSGSNSIDFPDCPPASDRSCGTTTCKPILIAPGEYIYDVDAGSDAAHPCSWPQPASVAGGRQS